MAGAPDPADPVEQALRCAHMALDMVAATREHTAPDGSELQIRVGIHVGPVMAGCVGSKLPFWTLFGDTVRGSGPLTPGCFRVGPDPVNSPAQVNTASRMESSSVPMRIQISEPAARLLLHARAAQGEACRFTVVERGTISVKGKGAMKTYFLNPKGDTHGLSSVWEGGAAQTELERSDSQPDTAAEAPEGPFRPGDAAGTDLREVVPPVGKAASALTPLTVRSNAAFDLDGHDSAELITRLPGEAFEQRPALSSGVAAGGLLA